MPNPALSAVYGEEADPGSEPFSGQGVRWIWDAYNRQTPNLHLLLRKRIALSGPVAEATCAVTAISVYRLYVNGVEVGRGPDPCEPEWQYYDTFDIREHLTEGDNTLAAHCYNYGVGTHFRPAGRGGLLFAAHITLDDGQKVSIVSDGSWQTSEASWYAKDGPQCYWTTGFQEICDLRQSDSGWAVSIAPEQHLSEFGSAWNRAIEYGGPLEDGVSRLIPREIAHLRSHRVLPWAIVKAARARFGESDPSLLGIGAQAFAPEDGLIGNNYQAPNLIHFLSAEEVVQPEQALLAAAASLASPDGDPVPIAPPGRGESVRLLLDFGREVVGSPFIDVAASADGVLDIAYSEALEPGGNLDMDRGSRQVDRVLFGAGESSWASFDRRAFRYLLLSFRGLTAPVSLRSAGAFAQGYPVEPAGPFQSSDPMLDRIWRTSVDTLKACMQSHYEDGPMRERGQYAGDLQCSALWNYQALGDAALARKGLRMFARSQSPEGWFRALYPSGTRHLIVDYMLNWLIAIREHYWFTGDLGFVKELLPAMRRVLAWFEQFTDGGGLIGGADERDWWVQIDWYDLDRRGVVAGLNMLYAQALRCMAELCGRLEMLADARAYAGQASEVKSALNARLWDSHRQAYADCEVDGRLSERSGAPTNILAITCDVAPLDRWPMISTFLDESAGRPTSPLFRTLWLLAGLRCGGSLDRALQGIVSYWGEMLNRGAVTWWETFDDSSPAGSVPKCSLCHAWGSGPLLIIARYLLGFDLLEPGGSKIGIAPVANSLAVARGSVPTMQGVVTIAHKKTASGREVVVTAPPGCAVVPDFAACEYATRVWVNGRLHV